MRSELQDDWEYELHEYAENDASYEQAPPGLLSIRVKHSEMPTNRAEAQASPAECMTAEFTVQEPWSSVRWNAERAA
jgi:hypothetical protein